MAEKKKCKGCEKLLKDYELLTNQLKLLQADFDNYKKRVDNERKGYNDASKAELVLELLPVIDSFHKALSVSSDEGFRLIFKNLIKVLEKEGLKEIKAENEFFNVCLHEAVIIVNSEREDNRIVQEVEKGYYFKGKVLRPAKVIVNKKA